MNRRLLARTILLTVVITVILSVCWGNGVSASDTEPVGDIQKEAQEKLRQEIENELQKLAESLDLSNIKDLTSTIDNDSLLWMKFNDIEDSLLDIVRNGVKLDGSSIAQGLKNAAVKALHKQSARFAIMASIIVLTALAGRMTDSLKGGVAPMARMVCQWAVIAVVASSMVEMAVTIGKLLQNLASMVMALLPPLTALMASSGSPGASAALNPISTFLIGALQQAVTVILVPLALGVTALGIAENFNKSLNLEGITDFVKKTFTYLCGILITVMLGTLVVQGVMAKSLDSITVKTAKYAMKNMIPIAGGFFSDTFDTVMACSGLMKNALGVMGMLILASMALAPMLDMLVFILSLRLCGALSKLAGEGEKNSVFDRAAEGADMLMIALGGSMVMLVVIIGIFLTMGGVATG